MRSDTVLVVAAALLLLYLATLALAHAGVMCTTTRVGNTTYTYCTGN